MDGGAGELESIQIPRQIHQESDGGVGDRPLPRRGGPGTTLLQRIVAIDRRGNFDGRHFELRAGCRRLRPSYGQKKSGQDTSAHRAPLPA